MVATKVFDDVQVTLLVMLRVLASLYVPVAMTKCLEGALSRSAIDGDEEALIIPIRPFDPAQQRAAVLSRAPVCLQAR